MACNIVSKSGFALASKCFYGFASSRPSNAESYDETILSLHITASMYVMSYVRRSVYVDLAPGLRGP